MAIHKLSHSTLAPLAALEDWGTVGQPITQPACALRGAKMSLPLAPSSSAAPQAGLPEAGLPEAGVWECSPGRYHRQIASAELMHIIAGGAAFTPDNGDAPITLRAGDVWFFEANTFGVWEIRSAVRKVYLVFSGGN